MANKINVEMKTHTRSESTMWLIGPTSDIIIGSKLPSTKQTLSTFFYHHWQNKDTIHRSAIYVAKEVMVFCQKQEFRPKRSSM